MIELIAQTRIPNGLRPALRKALKAVMQHYHAAQHDLTLVLTDDAEIRQLKLEHFGIDEATDVLSFPAWTPQDPFMPPHLGDIIISLETAQTQANARNHSLTREVVLLASHGFTHLMGHEHPHAEGLGFEETDNSLEWEVFHAAARVAYAALE
jgi:probable rRNA maturation factor